MPNSIDSDKIVAAIDLIRRTGASQVQIRHTDDGEPEIWMVVAIYNGKNPFKTDGIEIAASTTALNAALNLCEKLIDGGKCTHCKKPSALEPNSLLRMPFDNKICWYQYDPELKTFRRGCE